VTGGEDLWSPIGLHAGVPTNTPRGGDQVAARCPMKPIPYDGRFDPPAPVVPLRLRIPDPSGWVRFVGLVDTGADITVLPSDVAERYLPVGGLIEIRGVTGFIEEAVLYRAEVAIRSSRH